MLVSARKRFLCMGRSATLHAGVKSSCAFVSVGVSYLRLRPHEGKSHAAFEEVQINKSTGNALLFLQKDR